MWRRIRAPTFSWSRSVLSLGVAENVMQAKIVWFPACCARRGLRFLPGVEYAENVIVLGSH